jgi:hypothetical protein
VRPSVPNHPQPAEKAPAGSWVQTTGKQPERQITRKINIKTITNSLAERNCFVYYLHEYR